MHDVDLLERGLHRVRPLQLHRHIDRPELPADVSRPQPADVGVQRLLQLRLVLPDVDLRQLVLHPLAVLPRQVVMPIDQRHVGEDSVHTRVLRVQRESEEERECERDAHDGDCMLSVVGCRLSAAQRRMGQAAQTTDNRQLTTSYHPRP
jgi:hypothetical protein